MEERFGSVRRVSWWHCTGAPAGVVGAIGLVLAVLAGAWFGWFPGSDGQLTLVGRSWHAGYGSGGKLPLLFNWAMAATVLAPFVVASSFLVAAGRRAAPSGDRSGRAPRAAAIVAGDLVGWLLVGAVFVAVGAAAAANRSNWNNFGNRYTSYRRVTDDPVTVFNWPWASAAAMVIVLASAIAHGGTGRRPSTQQTGLWRARVALAVAMGSGGVVLAWAAARAAGSDGTSYERSPMSVELVGSGTNWLVFTPLAAGCVAAAVIRSADLWAGRVTEPTPTTARRLLGLAAAVGLTGVALAVGLASRFRLASHRLFDWSGTAAMDGRFNWTLFGLVIGPSLVAAAAIALRAVLTAPSGRRADRTAAAFVVVSVVGVLLAALLARHVGSDQWRMSVLRGGDDGRPLFNRFVFLAASGPFVATAGAAAAAWRALRPTPRAETAPD